MAAIHPFANESEAVLIGELTVENRLDRIEIYGTLIIPRDRTGLTLAKEVQALADSIVASLESAALPDRLPPAGTDAVPNPFD